MLLFSTVNQANCVQPGRLRTLNQADYVYSTRQITKCCFLAQLLISCTNKNIAELLLWRACIFSGTFQLIRLRYVKMPVCQSQFGIKTWMPASIFPCFVSLFAAYISNQDITDAELQEFVLGPDFPTGARNSWVHFCVWFYAHECIFVWFLRMSALLCVVCTYECTFVCGFYAWVHFCVISTRECTFVCGFYAWVHFCVCYVRIQVQVE